MNLRIFLLACLLGTLFSFSARCEIREIHSMKEILTAVEPGTWLVFDIDNTSLEPEGNLGSDQWFYYLSKIFKLKGLGEKEAGSKAMTVWNQAQSMIRVRPVEALTPDLIKKQQSLGIKTMGLTARTLDVSDKTLQQLDFVKIYFDQNTVAEGNHVIKKETLHSDDDALFKKGVLFVGESNSKGNVFTAFLKKLNVQPKKIVFVDDRLKHVKSMELAARELKIPYVGFRYGATDSKVKAYNEMVAEVTDKKAADLFFYGEIGTAL